MKHFEKKMYYSISEVSVITQLEAHIIRYWESEFPMLKPKKSNTGIRKFVQKDLDLILKIKQLLQEQNYTIQGAIKVLEKQKTAYKKEGYTSNSDIQEIIKELKSIQRIIRS